MYKTYIMVVCGIIWSAAYGMGYIDSNLYLPGLSLLGFGTAAGLRIAIKNLFAKINLK